jgi:hypothetical protein
VGLNAEICRMRADQWRQKAETGSDGPNKQACLEIAAGYEHLLELIEEATGQAPIPEPNAY